MTERAKERGMMTIAVIVMSAALLLAAQTEQNKGDPACQEDENWVVVDHQDPRGSEDLYGVSRACIHYSIRP
jgi:hypothetical protein